MKLLGGEEISETRERVLECDIIDVIEGVPFIADFIRGILFTPSTIESIGEIDNESGGDTCIGICMDDARGNDDESRLSEFEAHTDAIGDGVNAGVPEFDPP